MARRSRNTLALSKFLLLFARSRVRRSLLNWFANKGSVTVQDLSVLSLFANQFNKERRTLEHANNNKNFDSANVFRERRATGNYAHNATPTTNADYDVAMKYAAAMELKSTAQEGRISSSRTPSTDARSSHFRQSSRRVRRPPRQVHPQPQPKWPP